jgi:two-component system chemotaxis sensor kinase CheA
MIVGDAERRTALLVDELLGQHQVVAKSLGESLGRVGGLTGGAILGDGRVGLILDVAETVALAQGASERSLAERPAGRVATAA